MNKITHSHDLYFKHSLKNPDVARDFLKAFLPPELAEKINFSDIEIEPSSFVTPSLVEQFSDVIFKVSIQNKDAFVYLLVEHQSTKDPDIVFRVLSYSMQFMLEKAKQNESKRFPLVYPFVYYHGTSSPYPYPLDWASAFEDPEGLLPSILANPLHLIDLNQLPDDELENHRWLYAFAVTMKHIRKPQLADALIKAIRHLNALPQDQAVIELMISTIRYVLDQGEEINADFIENSLKDALPAPVQEEIMTISEQLKNIGREEGLQKGLQQGLQQGMQKGIQQGHQEGTLEASRKNLLKLANKKFGILPSSIVNEIESAPIETIDFLMDRIIEAETSQEWLAGM